MVLPKAMRIKGYRCFDHLHRSGIRYHSPSMVLRVVEARPQLLKSTTPPLQTDCCRCAITISSKVSKKAVTRNRLRRLFHDHLKKRLFQANKFSNTWALISLKPISSKKSHNPLLEECDKLLHEAGLLL